MAIMASPGLGRRPAGSYYARLRPYHARVRDPTGVLAMTLPAAQWRAPASSGGHSRRPSRPPDSGWLPLVSRAPAVPTRSLARREPGYRTGAEPGPAPAVSADPTETAADLADESDHGSPAVARS